MLEFGGPERRLTRSQSDPPVSVISDHLANRDIAYPTKSYSDGSLLSIIEAALGGGDGGMRTAPKAKLGNLVKTATGQELTQPSTGAKKDGPKVGHLSGLLKDKGLTSGQPISLPDLPLKMPFLETKRNESPLAGLGNAMGSLLNNTQRSEPPATLIGRVKVVPGKRVEAQLASRPSGTGKAVDPAAPEKVLANEAGLLTIHPTVSIRRARSN